MTVGRKYYHGPSASPYVIVKFLESLGFRLESRPQKARCYFYPTERLGRGRMDNSADGKLFRFPLILPQPRPGQVAVPGGIIDQNLFVNGIESGLLPPAQEALAIWEDLLSTIGPDTSVYCIETN